MSEELKEFYKDGLYKETEVLVALVECKSGSHILVDSVIDVRVSISIKYRTLTKVNSL